MKHLSTRVDSVTTDPDEAIKCFIITPGPIKTGSSMQLLTDPSSRLIAPSTWLKGPNFTFLMLLQFIILDLMPIVPIEDECDAV